MPARCKCGCRKQVNSTGDYRAECKPTGHLNRKQRVLEEDKKHGTHHSDSRKQTQKLKEDKKNGTHHSASRKQTQMFEEDKKNGTANSTAAKNMLRRTELDAELAQAMIPNGEGTYQQLVHHICTQEMFNVHGRMMSADQIMNSGESSAAMIYTGTTIQAFDKNKSGVVGEDPCNESWRFACDMGGCHSEMKRFNNPVLRHPNGTWLHRSQIRRSGAYSTAVHTFTDKNAVLIVERLIHQRYMKSPLGRRGHRLPGIGAQESTSVSAEIDVLYKLYMSVLPFDNFQMYPTPRIEMMGYGSTKANMKELPHAVVGEMEIRQVNANSIRLFIIGAVDTSSLPSIKKRKRPEGEEEEEEEEDEEEAQ